MSKLVKYAVALLFCLSFGFQSISYAATENGITTTLKKDGKYKYKAIEFFTAYDLGTDAGGTEVFNEAEEVGISSGAIDVSPYKEGEIQINYPTIGSTGIDFNIYGRLAIGVTPTTAWHLLYQVQVVSADASPTGVNITIPDNIDDVRVGCQATGTPGTDIITVVGKFEEGA